MDNQVRLNKGTSSELNGMKFINYMEVLTMIFIVLKLSPNSQVNDWSWWLVLSPILIPLGIVLVVVALVILYSFIMNVGRSEK